MVRFSSGMIHLGQTFPIKIFLSAQTIEEHNFFYNHFGGLTDDQAFVTQGFLYG